MSRRIGVAVKDVRQRQPGFRADSLIPAKIEVTQALDRITDETGSRRLVAIWVLLLLSVLPWREAVYYSGGLDSVVVAKALINLIALVMAWSALSQTSRRNPTGSRAALIVCTYLAVTVLGGWAEGSLVGSAVLAVRVGLLLVSMLLLTTRWALPTVVRAMTTALVLVAGLTAVSGLGTLTTTGRLGGGILPLSPNVLSMMLGAAVIRLFWRFVHSRRAHFDIAIAVPLVALTWATGSRTGLLALGFGIVLIIANSRKPRSSVFVGAVVAVPLSVFVVTSTGLFSAYFDRGGEQSVASLNSRTIAWRAAFDSVGAFWPTWFGRGLSAKTVSVSGTYWDSQVLDSSWVSAFVQGGVVGILLLGLWALTTVVASASMPHRQRALFLPMTVFALIWSVTASGLLDAYFLFLLMLVCSLASDRTTWRTDTDQSSSSGERELSLPMPDRDESG